MDSPLKQKQTEKSFFHLLFHLLSVLFKWKLWGKIQNPHCALGWRFAFGQDHCINSYSNTAGNWSPEDTGWISRSRCLIQLLQNFEDYKRVLEVPTSLIFFFPSCFWCPADSKANQCDPWQAIGGRGLQPEEPLNWSSCWAQQCWWQQKPESPQIQLSGVRAEVPRPVGEARSTVPLYEPHKI